MSSLERFPSFDAAAFEREQAAASRRAPRAPDPFAPGGVFGDGQLELPWRFPSPYAHPLPLGFDAHRVPLELDDNARYAMGLPSHHAKKHDHNKDDDAAAITPATYHQERRGHSAGHEAGPGTERPPYHTPLTPADDGGGRGPGGVVHSSSLEVPKTRDASPLPTAAFRQSDPFVEKDPSARRPQQQRPRSPTPATMMPWAYGLGPADARRSQLPVPFFAAEPTPTRPAAASRVPMSETLYGGDGGEPGPDVGPAARRRATPPENLHFAGFDGGRGGAEEDRRQASSATPSPLSVSPLSLGRAGSIATVRDLRAMAPPHRQISIRSLAPAAPPDIGDRPIIVTNALNHILYDGPCRHCEVNNCVCLLPSTTPTPLNAPADAADDDPAASPSGITAPGQQPDNIMTEGFCRHCVVNHCACVGDTRWGLHHAANALRNARLDEEHHRDTTTRRLVSDSGTVRRYESTTTEAEDGNGGSHNALPAGRSSPLFAAPLPAYLPLGRERVSSVDRGGFYDLEAQPRRDGSGGSGSSGRGMVSTFHFRHSFRAGGAGQGSSLRGRRTRRGRFASFVTGHLCRIFVVVIFILLIIVMAWVVWFYTNRDGVPLT